MYCPPRPPPGVNWRTVFKDLWSRRLLWAPSDENDEEGGIGKDGITDKGPETDSTTDSSSDGSGNSSSSTVQRSPVKKKKLMEATADSINVLVRFRPKQNKPSEVSSSGAAGLSYVHLCKHSRVRARM